MTFDETIEFLGQQAGRTVEISVAMRGRSDEEFFAVASISGRIDRVAVGGGEAMRETRELWRVWFVSDLGDQVTLHRSRFASAEVVADQPPPEEREQAGTTWSMTIREAALRFNVLVYV